MNDIEEIKHLLLKQTHNQFVNWIKVFMPVITVLITAFAAYFLVDRHAQKLAERTHELKVVEFEAQNVFRILDKYLEQQPYPELARHQMLGFISQTTHNEQLKIWADKQQQTTSETASQFLKLSREISLIDLQKSRDKFEIDQKRIDEDLAYKKEQNERARLLQNHISNLRDKLKSARSDHTVLEASLIKLDANRTKAHKALEDLKSNPPSPIHLTKQKEQSYNSKLNNLQKTFENLDEKFHNIEEKRFFSKGNLENIMQELKGAETDLQRISTN